ncbi:hypothetical protein E2C01_076536 [Portunus trituberculatus]|uniref:Reverse transcriptase zinc-binding domain-containing protein n=1 Tax=Portunus trituberculatus TaxID=210409 RepID=A0A5B7IK02_PORTR|nr:hypothetical protein [Portunus trituberculatus]
MSHDLKIETGHWSRTPRDLRVCPCDGQTTQTEHHVLVECALTRQTRQKTFPFVSHNLSGQSQPAL